MRQALLRNAGDSRGPDSQALDASVGSRAVLVFSLCATVFTIGQRSGHRYIDPGSGSFAIQIIIAAVLGGILSARLWLRHIFWRIFGRGRRMETEDQPSDEEADR